MRHITLLVVVLAVTPLTTVRAQDSLPVTVGDTVRITAPTLELKKYDGTLQGIRGGMLTVDTLQLAVALVTRLDVYRGRKSNWGKGALIGGTFLGLAFGGLGWWFCVDECEPRAALAAAGLVLGFAGGALIGGVIGALIKSDRWEEVPLDQLRVSFMPQRDGRFAFGLSVAF